jgi:hypothetical protein
MDDTAGEILLEAFPDPTKSPKPVVALAAWMQP